MDNSSSSNDPQSDTPRKVLFLGNGILRAFGNSARKCQELEHLICDVLSVSPQSDEVSSLIPFPMRIAASLLRKEDCYKALEKAIRALIIEKKKGKQTTDELLCDPKIVGVPLFRKLLKAGFTDIITTNYGYEIESVLLGRTPTYDTVKNDFYRSFCFPKNSLVKERKFKILKHYRSRDNGVRIWHIHGEYLRPHSIIFEYADYCSFLAKIKARPRPNMTDITVDNLSVANSEQEDNWIQTFLYGDVYVLGFGAAFGEPVFWYMMERRKRKNLKDRKVVFYEPKFEYHEKENLIRNQQQKAVLAMMDAFGAEWRGMGVTITKNSQFKEFYEKACKDIIAEVKGAPSSSDSSKRK